MTCPNPKCESHELPGWVCEVCCPYPCCKPEARAEELAAPFEALGLQNNSTVDDRERRNDLSCSFCPPNRKENLKNYKRRGTRPPKGKRARRLL